MADPELPSMDLLLQSEEPAVVYLLEVGFVQDLLELFEVHTDDNAITQSIVLSFTEPVCYCL